MGKQDEGKTVTRREVLKLAGTAAAFCTSFGFLHGSQTGGSIRGKSKGISELQLKWRQAEIKWYSGDVLLHSGEFPSKVLKHLQSDEMATVEIKWFRAGKLQQNLGKIAANR